MSYLTSKQETPKAVFHVGVSLHACDFMSLNVFTVGQQLAQVVWS